MALWNIPRRLFLAFLQRRDRIKEELISLEYFNKKEVECLLDAGIILDHIKGRGTDRMETRELVTKKLKEGLPIETAMQNLPGEIIAGMGMELVSFGANPTEVASYMSDEAVEANLSALLKAGASADELVSRVRLSELENLKWLRIFGVSREVLKSALQKCTPAEILPNLRWLMESVRKDKTGHLLEPEKEYLEEAQIYEVIQKAPLGMLERHLEQVLWATDNLQMIFETLGAERIVHHLDSFYEAGATPEELLKALGPQEVLLGFEWFNTKGLLLDPNYYLRRLNGNLSTSCDLEALLIFGADPFLMAQEMSEPHISDNLDLLTAYGLDINKVAHRILTPVWILPNLDRIMVRGEALRRIVRQADERIVARYFTELLDVGMSVRFLLKKIGSHLHLDVYLTQIAKDECLTRREKYLLYKRFSPRAIVRNLEVLEKYGFPIKIQRLIKKLSDSEIESQLEELFEFGAELDFEALVKNFNSWQIERHLALLLKVGVDANFIVDNVRFRVVGSEENLRMFLDLGVNPNILALKLDRLDREVYKEILLAHEATVWLD